MKLFRMALFLGCIAVIFSVAGCNKDNNRIVGKWKNQSLQEIVEFKSDKTGIFLVKGSPSLPFRWTMATDDNVKIDIPYQGESRTLMGNLEKDMFILNGQGEQAIYVRME
jgi:hypothetical protein